MFDAVILQRLRDTFSHCTPRSLFHIGENVNYCKNVKQKLSRAAECRGLMSQFSLYDSTPCEYEGPVYRNLLLTVLDSLQGFRYCSTVLNRTPTRVTQIKIQKDCYLPIGSGHAIPNQGRLIMKLVLG
jgi:hypothetical protein